MKTDQLITKIGLNIKKQREIKKMLQADLAAKCNMEVTALSRIENGNTNPTIGTLNKIAISLDIEAKEIIP